MVVSNSNLGSGGILMLDGVVALLLKDQVRRLGLLLDRALLWDKQVVAVLRRVYYQLWLTCRHYTHLDDMEI